MLQESGFEALDSRDIGLRTAPDEAVAAEAKARGLVLLSADFDFAVIRLYPPSEYPGIVVIERPDDSNVSNVVDMLRGLTADPDLLAALPGRLVIVGSRRIRVRPPLPE